MIDDDAELQQAVERLHSCKAVHYRVVPVTERWQGKVAWDGLVHVFKLEGHPSADHAFAWSSSIDGSTKRRYFAVLEAAPIASAEDAVRAAIVAEHRAQS